MRTHKLRTTLGENCYETLECTSADLEQVRRGILNSLKIIVQVKITHYQPTGKRCVPFR